MIRSNTSQQIEEQPTKRVTRTQTDRTKPINDPKSNSILAPENYKKNLALYSKNNDEQQANKGAKESKRLETWQ